jgi:hypothetical protein
VLLGEEHPLAPDDERFLAWALTRWPGSTSSAGRAGVAGGR